MAKHSWVCWLGVPLLAFIAYVTVLRVGFVDEDFLHVDVVRAVGFGPQLWIPNNLPNYRPIGYLFTFVINFALWGTNPLPYHLGGLLFHMGAALLLGLWLAQVSQRRWLGMLAGALFATYPLHAEPVAWLAAQDSVTATMFVLWSMFLFTRWWGLATAEPSQKPDAGLREGHRILWPLYAFSLVLYIFAIFSKESVFAFLPVFALSAWLVTPKWERRHTWVSGLALAPFGVALGLNVVIRVLGYGNLGGYQNLRSDYAAFFWDSFLAYGRILLAPVNPVLLGQATVQFVGAFVTVALLVCLALVGRRQFCLLGVLLVWIVLALLPVLNLSVVQEKLQNTRYLYLAAAGYCAGVATLLYEVFTYFRWRKQLALGIVGALLIACSIVTWIQLRPWHTSTVQVEDIINRLAQDIPPQYAPDATIWFIQDTPAEYKGTKVFSKGIGKERSVLFRDKVLVQQVENATEAPLSTDGHPDAFAMRFFYDDEAQRFPLQFLAGISHYTQPPAPRSQEEAVESTLVWDFTSCDAATVRAWHVMNASAKCAQGDGLRVEARTSDPQMIGPELSIHLGTEQANFLRIRTAVRYPALTDESDSVLDWFWSSEGPHFNGSHYWRSHIRQDGQAHVYWTFVPLADIGPDLTGLRLDPLDKQSTAEISWIAVDFVR